MSSNPREYLINEFADATKAFESERKRRKLNYQSVMNLHFQRSKTNLLLNMVRNESKDPRLSSILTVANTLGFDVVFRQRPTPKRSEVRFDLIRAEMAKAAEEVE